MAEKETNDSFGKPNGFDDIVSLGTQSLAHTTLSRRNFLGWAAKFVLALAGASLVEVLPIDREVLEAEATAGDCNAWYLCGIYTPRVCSCAYGGNNSCPCGLSAGNNPWFSCCYYNGTTYRVYYYDCCCNGTCSGCSYCSKSGCDCYHAPQPLWCGGVSNAHLCCTKYAVSGIC